jgi:hypothetical protein
MLKARLREHVQHGDEHALRAPFREDWVGYEEHLAAALGIPVVAIFGPTDPARNGPYGTHSVVLRHAASATSYRHHDRPDEALRSIPPAEVVRAALRLLGAGNG